MRSPLLLVALVVGSAILAGARAEAGAQRETEQRHVFVGVTNARGQAVTGLTPADFIIREDDIAREVVRVAPAPPPTHLAILVDNGGDAAALLADLRSSLVKFVFGFTALPSPPLMSLATFAERPSGLVPFTTSDVALERGIQRIIPRANAGAYPIDAVVEAAQALHKEQATRPAVVAFVNDASPPFSNVVHTRAAEALNAVGASLWTVELQQSNPQNSVDERERASLLGDVTKGSGGQNVPILSREGLDWAFASIASAMLGRYDVTYGRPETLIPPSRLVVETRDKSLRVSAPRGTGR